MVNHSAGAKSLGTGNERANAWFVGMRTRRNPDMCRCCPERAWRLGADAAAPIAARVIEAYVDSRGMLHRNLIAQHRSQCRWARCRPDAGPTPTNWAASRSQAQAGQPADPEVASIRGGHVRFLAAGRRPERRTTGSDSRHRGESSTQHPHRGLDQAIQVGGRPPRQAPIRGRAASGWISADRDRPHRFRSGRPSSWRRTGGNLVTVEELVKVAASGAR